MLLSNNTHLIPKHTTLNHYLPKVSTRHCIRNSNNKEINVNISFKKKK